MQTFRESLDVAQTVPASPTPGALSEQWGVPVLQALTGGVLIGVLSFLVCWMFFSEDVKTCLKVGGILAAIATALLYLVLLADSRRLLWARFEPVATAPLAPSAARERVVLVNAPKPEAVRARLQEQADTARQSRFAGFVKACEQSTAKRDLLKQFTDAELSEFRAALFRLGLARNRGTDPRQGWELARPASEIVAKLKL